MGLAGCAYHAPDGTADPIDAPAVIDMSATPDMAIDQNPAATCDVGVTGTPVDRGKVGLSNGGGLLSAIACPSDRRMVGLALDLSDGNADGVTRSARGIQIGCASLTIDGTGPHVGAVTLIEVAGNGGSGWSPSTLPPLTRCPDGAVVSGLAVHGSNFTSYFLDATMACTELDSSGNVVATTQVHINGSGTDANNPSSAACNAGEQVVSMTTNTGAGLDSVRLVCAATDCD